MYLAQTSNVIGVDRGRVARGSRASAARKLSAAQELSVAEEWNEWRKERREESRDFLNALFAILDRLNREPPPSAA